MNPAMLTQRRLSIKAYFSNGTVVAVAFVLVANIACLAGAGRLVTPAFVGGAALLSLVLGRRRPLAALEFALWLWVLGPQVRRMVDWVTVYHEPSLILAAAPLASLVHVTAIRNLRASPLRAAVRPLLVFTAAVGFGFVVGVIRLGLPAAATALLTWAVPVLLGMQLIAIDEDSSEVRASIDRFITWSTLVVGVYGLVQFYLVPPWDAYWMSSVSMGSIGSPVPFEVRVFSTVNAPGPLAMFLVAAVLYLTDSGHRMRVPALVAGVAALALSQVRAAWLAWSVGVLIVLISGRPRARATALVALAAISVFLVQTDSPLQEVVASRIEESGEIQEDDSVAARVTTYEEMLPTLGGDPVGQGVGAERQLAANDGSRRPIAIDSGLLEFGYFLGLPTGLIAISALLFGGFAIARIGLRRGVVRAGVIAGGLSVIVQLPFGNTVLGVGGVMLFLLWGLAIREVVTAPDSETIVAGRTR